jgi:hypothetical protein
MIASAGMDAERFRLYFDLILTSLSEGARSALKSMSKLGITDMRSLGYEYQSDFARHYVAEGEKKGRKKGRSQRGAELVLKQLTLRFGAQPKALRARLRNASDTQLDAVAEALLTAHTLEEALAPLPSNAVARTQA